MRDGQHHQISIEETSLRSVVLEDKILDQTVFSTATTQKFFEQTTRVPAITQTERHDPRLALVRPAVHPRNHFFSRALMPLSSPDERPSSPDDFLNLLVPRPLTRRGTPPCAVTPMGRRDESLLFGPSESLPFPEEDENRNPPSRQRLFLPCRLPRGGFLSLSSEESFDLDLRRFFLERAPERSGEDPDRERTERLFRFRRGRRPPSEDEDAPLLEESRPRRLEEGICFLGAGSSEGALAGSGGPGSRGTFIIRFLAGFVTIRHPALNSPVVSL